MNEKIPNQQQGCKDQLFKFSDLFSDLNILLNAESLPTICHIAGRIICELTPVVRVVFFIAEKWGPLYQDSIIKPIPIEGFNFDLKFLNIPEYSYIFEIVKNTILTAKEQLSPLLGGKKTSFIHSKNKYGIYLCFPLKVLKEAPSRETLDRIKKGSLDYAFGAVFMDARNQSKNFTYEHISLISEFSQFISTLIEDYLNKSTQKQRSSEQKIKEERFLLIDKISQGIISTLKLDELLDIIMKSVLEITKADRGFLMLLNDKGELEFKKALNAKGETLGKDHFEISSTIVEEVMSKRKSIYLTDVQKDRKFSHKTSIINLELARVMCTPLIAKDKLIGLIYVDSKKAFEDHFQSDLQFFESLATSAAIALENARLHQQILEQQRTKQEMEHLKLMDQRKTEFLRMVAHELKSPLGVISEYFSLLPKLPKHETEEYEKILNIISDQLGRMRRLVNDLLDLFRIRSAPQRFSKEVLPLRAVVALVMDAYRLIAEKKNLELFNYIDENIYILGNKDLLVQLFMNLVGNAVKYSYQSGKIEVRAEIIMQSQKGETALLNGKWIKIKVIDEGIGIPDEDKEKVFEVFYRVEKNRSGDISGSGIGLAIARSIVELHQGKIWVEDNIPSGSIFFILLPLENNN